MLSLTPEQALQVAMQEHRAGRLSEAETLYRQILAANPRHADALHLLGMIVQTRGQLDDAADLMRQAIAADPSVAFYQNSLGNVLQQCGALSEAVAAYRQGIALEPNFAATYNNLGNALRLLGDLAGALLAYREALRREPSLAETHNNLGDTLRQLGQLEEAEAALRGAVALQPDYPMAHNNLGNVLLARHQVDEAIAAYGRALAIAPDFALADNNLGNALSEKGQRAEAVAAYRRAIQADPEQALAHNNLANALKERGEMEEALEHYGQALVSQWSTSSIHSNYLAALQYAPKVSLPALAEAHRAFEGRHARPLYSTWQPHAQAREPERPLRLGFVSAHFSSHPAGFFLVRCLENLDRGQFIVTCYADAPRQPDPITERLSGCASQWQQVERESDEQLAQRIRGDQIDILFDLAGHTAGNRLLVFARKPAPVQITWLDYVGTTGLSAIDYILADPRQIPPEFDRFYAEKVLRMPDDYITFDPPAMAPAVGPLPAMANGFVTFASFNITAKTTPPCVALWSRVLREVPGARLLLMNGGFDDPVAISRYRELFARHSVDPGRIIFRGWTERAELLAFYNTVDLALDTLPYNGGLTTLEAMWMGVPVITLPGETFASRHGLAHLTAAGVPETIARDPDDYVRIAAALAGDLPKLAARRAELRQRVAGSPLCDGPRFARHFGGLLREAWRRWCAEGTGTTGNHRP
jgi:predicted O-linked N-acetylglucosamine transferase (SPINDLY family)